MIEQQVSVILCRPLYPRNIGQCARAISNLGFQNLIIIDGPNLSPEEFFEARQGAARGQGPLQNAVHLKSWEEFYQKYPEGLRIGFCRRSGPLRPISPWKDFLKGRDASSWFEKPLYLVFGSEDHGLENRDLEFLHHICELPAWGEETHSYNLAQAVLLALYMLRDQTEGLAKPESKNDDVIEKVAHFFPDSILKEWIEILGFDLELRTKVNAHTVLKRLLLKNEPTPKELRVLEAVVFQTVRKLKEWKPLR